MFITTVSSYIIKTAQKYQVKHAFYIFLRGFQQNSSSISLDIWQNIYNLKYSMTFGYIVYFNSYSKSSQLVRGPEIFSKENN